MNICTSVNSLYVNYLCVMLTSLFRNNRGEDINLYILENDLTHADKKKLSDIVSGYRSEITFLHIDLCDFECFSSSLGVYPYETFFRLKLSEILPKETDRILYLDVDILVRGNLEDFYNTIFHDDFFIACRDMFTGMDAARIKFFKRKSRDYFNAGVMLWNLDKLRDYSFNDFIKAAEEIDYYMPCADQDILNYMFSDKVRYVDPEKYNYIAAVDYDSDKDYRKTDPLILHFAGANPWKCFKGSAAESEWFDYASSTPYYTEILEQIIRGLSVKKNDTFSSYEKLYELAFEIKSTGQMSTSFDDTKIIIYGAGKIECIIEEILRGSLLYENVLYVVDRIKEGRAFGKDIHEKLDAAGDDEKIFIVAATIRNKTFDEIKIKAQKLGHANVISAYDFLNGLIIRE